MLEFDLSTSYCSKTKDFLAQVVSSELNRIITETNEKKNTLRPQRSNRLRFRTGANKLYKKKNTGKPCISGKFGNKAVILQYDVYTNSLHMDTRVAEGHSFISCLLQFVIISECDELH